MCTSGARDIFQGERHLPFISSSMLHHEWSLSTEPGVNSGVSLEWHIGIDHGLGFSPGMNQIVLEVSSLGSEASAHRSFARKPFPSNVWNLAEHFEVSPHLSVPKQGGDLLGAHNPTQVVYKCWLFNRTAPCHLWANPGFGISMK